MTLSTPPPASASDATVAVPISYGASQSKLLAIGIGRGRPPGALNSDGSKPKRKRITPEQLEVLTELFEQTDTPSFEIRESLAGRLSMTNREVQVWFQNRRAKMNRLRAQGHPVPASNNPEKAAALAGVQNVQASNSKSGPKFRKVVSPKDGKVARPSPIHHQSPPSELVDSSSYHSFPQPPPHYY
ncbi:homeobox-domain-containing protein, partial [Atractiella rhizophila]